MNSQQVEKFVNEVRLLFHEISNIGQQLHYNESISMSMRAVLEVLYRNGPSTVPDMARERLVSRQHIQSIVNSLLPAGLVENIDNPAHRKSPLIQLTIEGEATIKRMNEKEEIFYDFFCNTSTGFNFLKLNEELSHVRECFGIAIKDFSNNAVKKGDANAQ